MAFPTPPDVDIPRWCYAGGTYLEPSLTRRQVGWTVQSSGYGTIPGYQEENWINYSAGEWINYLAAYALPYVAAGKFDAGLELYNNQPAKFYNAANDKYTSIKSSPSQSAASVPLVLPPALPTTPLPMVSDAAGTMSFSTISSSAVAGITNGSAPINGQVGEYFVFNNFISTGDNIDTIVTQVAFNPGIWRFSFTCYFAIGNVPTSFTNYNSTEIFIRKILGDPTHVNGYDRVAQWSLTQVMTSTLPAYFVNSSTVFTLYFLVNTASNTSSGANVWSSVTAQRIA